MQRNITFLDLIEHYSICIPKIQRDYAQGREDNKTTEIREFFLEEMIETLTAKESNPLVLDFVYGSTDNKNVFTPLDGQQRLTTLFLLHWYLLPTEKSQILKDKIGIPRFTYETRISSKDFCKSLVAVSPEIIKDNMEKSVSENKNEQVKKEWTLSESIKNEPWFLWSWRKDPTIKGMLVMLDAIDRKLKTISDRNTLWNNLTERGRIVFHLLPLDQFNLTDELYVKMNARGKELSDFDILKSTLEEQMKRNNVCECLQEKWRTHIDSKWMDLFWIKKAAEYLGITNDTETKKEEAVDAVEIFYLRFLKRMMYFHLFMIDDFQKPEALDSERFSEGIKSVRMHVRNNDIITIVPQLSKCEFFNTHFYSFVVNTMEQLLYKADNKIKEGGEFVTIPFWKIDNRPVDNIFEMFIDEKITYLGRILFFAQVQFFKYHKAENLFESENLKKELNNWMRIIRNLAYNTSYNDVDEFRNTIKTLEVLAATVYEGNDAESVLDYFANDGEVGRFDKEQVSEEKEKAHQIQSNEDWINKIMDAENFAFWQGCVRFLFTDRENVYNWNLFDTRFTNAQKYFDVNGVSDEYKRNARLICTFISLFTKWKQCWGNNKVRIGNGVEVWGYIIRNNNLLQPLVDLFDLDTIPLFVENFPSQIEKVGYEQTEQLVHKDMYNNRLIDEAISIMGEGVILNSKNDQFALYRPTTRADWKKYVIGNKRNKILFDLRTRGVITTKTKEYGEQNISGLPYFWGWDIYFENNNTKYYIDRMDKLYVYNEEIEEWENEGISLEQWITYL
jgi:hypothetical protein